MLQVSQVPQVSGERADASRKGLKDIFDDVFRAAIPGKRAIAAHKGLKRCTDGGKQTLRPLAKEPMHPVGGAQLNHV